MKRIARWIMPAALLAVLAPLAAHAQGGPPPGGPGGFQMTPQMQAKFRAWQQFRDNHKNYQALQQTMSGFAEMDKDPRTQLTKAQARQVLTVIKQWRNKPA